MKSASESKLEALFAATYWTCWPRSIHAPWFPRLPASGGGWVSGGGRVAAGQSHPPPSSPVGVSARLMSNSTPASYIFLQKKTPSPLCPDVLLVVFTSFPLQVPPMSFSTPASARCFSLVKDGSTGSCSPLAARRVPDQKRTFVCRGVAMGHGDKYFTAHARVGDAAASAFPGLNPATRSVSEVGP